MDRRRLVVFRAITRDISPDTESLKTYEKPDTDSNLSLSLRTDQSSYYTSSTEDPFSQYKSSIKPQNSIRPIKILDPGTPPTPSLLLLKKIKDIQTVESKFLSVPFQKKNDKNGSFTIHDETNSESLNSSGNLSNRSQTMNSTEESSREKYEERRKPKKRPLEEAERSFYVIKLENILNGKDFRTTVMIKNIPNKYTQKMLLLTIDKKFSGTYNFLYLPIDFKNRCNVGYAFINFLDYLTIVLFFQEFNAKRWEKFNSEKICALAYGRIQGLNDLLHHFQNSSVINQEDNKVKPIILGKN